VRTSDFDFALPEELIAQIPTPERDRSRLLVLERAEARFRHGCFTDLRDYLRPGDLLVLNNTRVIAARLRGLKAHTGGQIEVFLLEENNLNDWWVLVRPGKRVRGGTSIWLLDVLGQRSGVEATVLEKNAEGHCRLKFLGVPNILEALDRLGTIPLPPYIVRSPQTDGINDVERYQTVFGSKSGSVAAPTAGLHFTEALLSDLRMRGVALQYVTLHVGLGTFAPVKSEMVESHHMHEESFVLSAETAHAIHETKNSGGRVVAVGTTSLRVLESVAAANQGQLVGMEGRTRIFIYPPYQFLIADALITNFHLPQSTLLMLVSAFAAPNETRGRELILSAYAEAIRERYRFFSYGDAMLIL
jgi:S-adenosylmethionine:tRNA ribosyltransferase-isomerase